MNDDTRIEQLRYLGLSHLAEHWEPIIAEATRTRPSYHRFLSELVAEEFEQKTERARLARLSRAKIPELLLMETFPFHLQPRLKRSILMDLYDSLRFISEAQSLLFIGPTGCGKTGLATAFLIHAINQGLRGFFVDFNDLLGLLYQARGDHSEAQILRRFSSYQVLLIDELGYLSCEKEQASLFFDLMRRRHQHATTIITTQLGFEEWGSFLHDPHLTAALLDRITVNCAVFNMKDCLSIRPKKILYGTQESAVPDTDNASEAP